MKQITSARKTIFAISSELCDQLMCPFEKATMNLLHMEFKSLLWYPLFTKCEAFHHSQNITYKNYNRAW